MLTKLCPKCQTLIPINKRYCDDCQLLIDKSEHGKQRYKRYKANRTDKQEQRFYSSKQWTSLREAIKARDKGLCRLCAINGNIAYMDTVHHIKELKDCWDDRVSPSNLISLCESCHQRVHKEYLKSKTDKIKMQDKLKKIAEGDI